MKIPHAAVAGEAAGILFRLSKFNFGLTQAREGFDPGRKLVLASVD